MRVLRSLRPLPVLLALGLLLAAPGGTLAASDKVIREPYTDFLDNVPNCGLTVDVAIEGTFRATIHNWVIGPADPPADGFWIGNFNDHGSAIHTNTANGKSVVISWVVNVKEASIVYVGNGDWDYTYAVNGVPVNIGGKPVDVGRIVITDTIHFGDLSTDTDDFFVSGFASFVAGPHPAYESEAGFCTPYLAAIG
jgi:hypothetical protein